MDKKEFKTKVLDWIKTQGIDISDRKVRVFNSKRYGLEVRIYQEPMEMVNKRKSFRTTHYEQTNDGFRKHGTTGYHSRKISLYTHINEEDFNNEAEKSFILEMLKA